MNPNREKQPFPDPSRPWIEAVVEYHANPLESRTVKKLMQDLGLHLDTYYKFMSVNKDAVYAEADKRRKKFYGPARAHAWKALIARFGKSDKALQMFFEMVGDYVPKSEQIIKYSTPEQKRKKAKELIDELLRKNDPNA